MTDLKDSIETFVNSRVKSPYFGSVFATWLLTNRVVLFGLFHFDESMKLEDKLKWMHQKLSDVPVFGTFHLHGLTWTIIWALGVGAIVMIAYNKIAAYSKLLYLWINKSSVSLLQQVEPAKYVEINVHTETEKDLIKNTEELAKRKSENSTLQKQAESLSAQVMELNTQIALKQQQLDSDMNTKSLYEEELRDLKDEKKKFRITYASYGMFDKQLEVTRIVSDLFNKQHEFNANNETFGFDPIRFRVKELIIKYAVDGKNLDLIATEDDLIHIQEGIIFSTRTILSQTKKMWRNWEIELIKVFKGVWQFTMSKPNNFHQSLVRIDEQARFFEDDEHIFDIQVKEFSNNLIILKKIDLQGNLVSTENLRMTSDQILDGTTLENYAVTYTFFSETIPPLHS